MSVFRLFAFLLALVLSACATRTSVPVLPEKLEGKGLLTARIHVADMQSMNNADVMIDGRIVSSSMRQGYLAVPLEAGEHTIQLMRTFGTRLASAPDTSPQFLKARTYSAPTYIYVPGPAAPSTISLRVDRTFKIEPGKVTNLGLIVYLPVMENPEYKQATVNNSRNFMVANVDNTTEARAFLRTNYPKLVAGLDLDNGMILAPGKYIEVDKLPNLRRSIASHEIKGQRIIGNAEISYIYGPAGTIVSVARTQDEKKPDVHVYDTGTLADVVGAAKLGDKHIFLTSDAQLLSIQGKEVGKSRFPFEVQPILLKSTGSQGVLAMDNRTRIYTSINGLDGWKQHETPASENARDDVFAPSDGEGIYITIGSSGMPDQIWYLANAMSSPKALPPIYSSQPGVQSVPKFALNYPVARPAGLYMMFLNHRDFYFWSKSTQAWKVQSKPEADCKPPRFDVQGSGLSIECQGKTYRSEDSGSTWFEQKS